MSAPTIFVSIASYRDNDCKNTLSNVFASAKYPERVYVGTCEQNMPEAQNESCYVDGSIAAAMADHVRRIQVHALEARGPTWARFLCASLWQGERYFLQLDSHMRLVDGWDEKLIQMERQAVAQSGNELIVLSTYAGLMETYGQYKAGDQEALTSSPRMCQAFFNEQGMVSFHGANILTNTKELVEVPFVAGGLMFFKAAEFFRLVPFDPYLDDIFVGEEILLSARIWTSGFDIFCPNENIAFHQFTRENEPKFWANERDDSDADLRVRYLLGLLKPGQEPTKRALRNVGRYGLGQKRTLEAYWQKAGLDVNNRRAIKNFCGTDLVPDPHGGNSRVEKRVPQMVALIPGLLVAALVIVFGIPWN